MKNKKGFTLVELLVTIVVLGIVTGISIPLIRNIRNGNEDKQYTTYMSSLKYSAKLYVDSYTEDLFGHEESGCAIIKYTDLEDKSLVNDISLSDVSCATEDTYIRVVKLGEKYGYSVSLGCGNKDSEGKVESITVKYPEEVISKDSCGIDAKTIMDFQTTPEKSEAIKYKRRNVTLTISSTTGVHTGAEIQYGFSKDKGTTVEGGWASLPISITGEKKQKERIEAGETISIDSDKLTTPTGLTGDYYLVLRIDKLQDVLGRAWTTDKDQSKYLYFGPYRVDNLKPTITNLKVSSQSTSYHTLDVIIDFEGKDEKFSTSEDLKMCISESSNDCASSAYVKYNSSFPYKVSGDYDGGERTIYVHLKDAAKNYISQSVKYRVARRYTLTYDSNGGNACAPNKKSVTFDSGSNPKWENLCQTTRENYTFTGWNTRANGTGNTVTKDTIANGNLTVYAQWRKNKVIFQYQVLSGETLTANTMANDGTRYTWTKDTNNYIYQSVNGGASKIYQKGIDFDATTLDLANYNNTKFINITKTRYTAVNGKQWICVSGCKTNNQTFSHSSISVTPSTICDCSKRDCTVTLKVNWEDMTYNIQYTLNGGTQATTGVPTTYTYGVGATINGKPTRSGYTFNGWTYGTSKKFEHTISKTDAGDKTFTANWCQNCASVANGSCSLNASTAGICTYVTSCNSGYDLTAGSGTRNPTCTKRSNEGSNVVRIQLKVDGGVLASTHGSQFAINSSGLVTMNGSTIIHEIKYGESLSSAGLLNYHNSEYLNLEKSCLVAEKKAEWVCESGCATSGKTYDQSKVYAASDFCDASKESCTVTLKVNWVKQVEEAKAFYWKFKTGNCKNHNGEHSDYGNKFKGRPYRTYYFYNYECHCEMNADGKYCGNLNKTKEYPKGYRFINDHTKYQSSGENKPLATIWYRNGDEGTKACKGENGYQRNQQVYKLCHESGFDYDGNDSLSYHGYVWYYGHPSNPKYSSFDTSALDTTDGIWLHSGGNYDKVYSDSSGNPIRSQSDIAGACDFACKIKYE